MHGYKFLIIVVVINREAAILRQKVLYKPNSHAFFDVSWCNLITEIHYKLGKLFDVDDVLGIIGVRVDDLRTACYLQWLFTCSATKQLVQFTTCIGCSTGAQFTDDFNTIFGLLTRLIHRTF